jgi:putative ABC transport system substrate-binding protein
MNRRTFIILLSCAAAWARAAVGQETAVMRRVGVLMPFAADDPQSPARVATLQQGLQKFGWVEGRNLRIDWRWAGGDPGRVRRSGEDLLALNPDVILATGSATMGPLQQMTTSVPIVFVNVVDPVGAGFIDTLARPGRNVTGFTQFEFGISGKWLELLKQVAPRLTRVAVIRDPAVTSGIGQLGAIQSVAPALGVELRPIDARDPQEIERTIAHFAHEPNGGLIVPSGAAAIFHRRTIIALAGRHHLPAVYPYRVFAREGGLMSYGPDPIEPYDRAAGYIDRILKGTNPADLPVQAPTRYELVINLKTAKMLGLEVPPTLLARADEVIE